MTEEKDAITEKESKLAKDVLKIIAQSDIRLGAREIWLENLHCIRILLNDTSYVFKG